MSHEITLLDSVGLRKEPAWHKLGKVFNGELGVREAIAEYLGWETQMEPVFGRLPDGTYVEIPGYAANARTDLLTRDRYLAVLGDTYKPIQASELGDDIEIICGEAGATVETIGSLKGGRIVWILLEMKENSNIKLAGDQFKEYLLVTNTHDGTRAYEIMPTTVRVVCWNTWTYATNGSRSKFRHTPKVRDRIAQARQLLGDARTTWSEFGNLVEGLAKKPVSDMFMQFAADTLMGVTPEEQRDPKLLPVATANKRDEVLAIMRNGGIGGLTRATRKSAFGVYNAITEFTEWHKRTRITENSGVKSSEEARLISNWYGNGMATRQSALDWLLDEQTQAVMEADNPLDLVLAAQENSNA